MTRFLDINIKMKQINLLFVCKHNRFRSQLALGFFNKYNKNKKIKAESAGIFKGMPVAFNVRRIAKKYGVKTGKPRTIDEKLLVKLDYVVIVADNVPASLFDRKNIKKIIVWKIPDTSQDNFKRIEEIALMVREKVIGLVEELR